MDEYGLGQSEVVLSEFENVSLADGKFFSASGDLALTNQRIVFVQKDFFGRVKNRNSYPLSSIKVYQNKAQIKYDQNVCNLVIYLSNEILSYNISSIMKKDVIKFINQINKLLFGEDAEEIKNTIPGLESLTSALKDTVNVVKGSFGIKEKENKGVQVCPGCGYRISGIKGKVVRCQYCGTSTKIE